MYYKLKSEWAAAKAAESRKLAGELRFTSSRGSYSRAARKYESLRILEDQALKFDRLANKYQQMGM